MHHARDWSAGGPTDADNLFFGCGCDHAAATDRIYTTTVTEDGRIAWFLTAPDHPCATMSTTPSDYSTTRTTVDDS